MSHTKVSSVSILHDPEKSNWYARITGTANNDDCGSFTTESLWGDTKEECEAHVVKEFLGLNLQGSGSIYRAIANKIAIALETEGIHRFDLKETDEIIIRMKKAKELIKAERLKEAGGAKDISHLPEVLELEF